MSRTGRRYFRWLRYQFGLTTWHYYFKSEIGGVSTVGISLPKTGVPTVPTVCSERAVSGILYAESTLSTDYTQYVYCYEGIFYYVGILRGL